MKEDEKLKNIALKVLHKSQMQPENYGFASITILMVISIMLTCVRILQECDKNQTNNFSQSDKYSLYGEQLRTFSTKRSLFTKMRIKKILRRELDPDDYAKYSFSILSALLDAGENLTDDEIITLVEAAHV